MTSLQDHLATWAGGDAGRGDLAAAIVALAQACVALSGLIGRGPLAGAMHAATGDSASGDAQTKLDVAAHRLVLDALAATSVGAVLSEEAAAPLALSTGGRLAVAVDPLDGSSNIDTNIPLGTIFGIWQMPQDGGATAAFAQAGERQLAAGFVIYGPCTALVLTVRDGTHVFTLDRDAGAFLLTAAAVTIRAGRPEYAINASNYRHWSAPVRAYVDDCVAGTDGPRGADFNMRWIASLVAEVFRILFRGGIFLYPADARLGYGAGRLRLLYEAAPIALLVEQAGGGASDGARRILDIVPEQPHQRIPLIFGSRDKVDRLRRYHGEPPVHADRAPLFGQRGLFRV